MHNSSKSMIPSMEQRKSQINLLNFMEQEKQRRDSKEFLFPDDNLLHKRRPSAHVDHSATQSEDDESAGSFEVNRKKLQLISFHFASRMDE